MANNRDSVGSGPDASEPKTETIPGRSFAGASYGANAQEHTDDVLGKNDLRAADVADGGVSENIPDNGKL